MITALAILLVASSLVAGNAASLGTITVGTLGASGTTFTACNGITTNVRTRYVAASTRYEIGSVLLTTIPAACQNKPYRMTLAQGNDTGTSLGELQGTTTAASASTTISFTSGAGPLLNTINNNNPGNIKVVLVITS